VLTLAVNWEVIENAQKVMKVAGYCRVSTLDQVKGISLEYQAEKISKWADFMEYTTEAMYVEKGESGAKAERTELSRLLEDAKEGKFDMVVVWKVDRFSRDLAVAVDVYRELQKLGITLFILDGNIDTSTPMGKMLFYQLSIFAEMERDNIKERLLMGKTDKVEKGSYIAKKPLGYNVEDGQLYKNEEEAKIVKHIFKLRAYDKMTYRAIAEELNNQGISSPSGNNKWSHNSVVKILKNKLYLGEYKTTIEGREYTGTCEPLVSKQVFGRANSK
jgi:site-specific DNA recombinase